jgi:hypothetical protein
MDWPSPQRWSIVADVDVTGRIRSLISSIPISLVGELDAEEALKNPSIQPYLDIQAYQKLMEGNYDKVFDYPLFPSLSDDIVDLKPPEYVSLLNTVKQSLEVDRISQKYAYIVRISEDNRFRLHYASSRKYFDRFNQLTMYYESLLKSLNDMLWDTLQYISYKVLEARDAEIKKKIYSYYSRIPSKYLDVIVYSDEVVIYAPLQLMARIIGRKGSTINQLQTMIGKKVKVRKDKNLTDLYSQEHPEVPSDPELVRMISQAIVILDELERKGVTAEQVLRIRQSMRSEEEACSEEDAQLSSGS